MPICQDGLQVVAFATFGKQERPETGLWIIDDAGFKPHVAHHRNNHIGKIPIKRFEIIGLLAFGFLFDHSTQFFDKLPIFKIPGYIFDSISTR